MLDCYSTAAGYDDDDGVRAENSDDDDGAHDCRCLSKNCCCLWWLEADPVWMNTAVNFRYHMDEHAPYNEPMSDEKKTAGAGADYCYSPQRYCLVGNSSFYEVDFCTTKNDDGVKAGRCVDAARGDDVAPRDDVPDVRRP